MTDPIDRALERLRGFPRVETTALRDDAADIADARNRPILTDLAADLRGQWDRERWQMVESENTARARLAAVVERIRHGIDWETYEGHESFHEFCVELETLARGEGGSDD